jgi:hypothetical protein
MPKTEPDACYEAGGEKQDYGENLQLGRSVVMFVIRIISMFRRQNG